MPMRGLIDDELTDFFCLSPPPILCGLLRVSGVCFPTRYTLQFRFAKFSTSEFVVITSLWG